MQCHLKSYCLCLIFLQGICLFAQTNTAIVTTADGRPLTIVDNINGAVVPVIKPNNVEGTPYLGDDWATGNVYFTKGKKADSISLRFNLQDNKLYFRRDGITLAFVEEVTAFFIQYTADSTTKSAWFKNGYPGVNRQKSETFYNVVVEGARYHLLRRLSKTINDIYVYNGLDRKKYTFIEEWYVFNVAANSMEKIKPDISSLQKKMPKVAVLIKEIVAGNKLDLRTEADLTTLFTILNQPNL